MAIAASAPVLPKQKKKQCCKIARFADAPCIIIVSCYVINYVIYLTRCIFNLLSEKRKVYEIVKLIHLSKFFLAISSKNRHFTIYDTFQT